MVGCSWPQLDPLLVPRLALEDVASGNERDSYQTLPVPTTPSTRGHVDVGDPLALRRVFDKISGKDVSAWIVLVSSLMKIRWMRDR